ncbi:MAG: dynein regulation protein LC7 [Acidobacteria bacterium]|nr:MAG: dynein regulation protein LC7 [Acidobacteriota bacterium]PIE90552.1 MAG: dynein regulation protein LC7 [Acidobacteriota bacterium]
MDLIMYEEEYKKIQATIDQLQLDARAKIVFVVDKNGQQIASAGEINSVDATSLASLTAGNVAATDGLAKLIGEKEFSILFHEGEKDNIHISIVANRVILVVIFDERSSLGLVRLRVKKSSHELSEIFTTLMDKAQNQEIPTEMENAFSEITDDDIDNLFG